ASSRSAWYRSVTSPMPLAAPSRKNPHGGRRSCASGNCKSTRAIRSPLLMNSAASQPLLAVRGVTLQYKTRDHLVTATYRVDLDVLRSDRFVILGPSGCGKSTLLKAVGGYMRPVEGSMKLNGIEIHKPGPDRVMVFQEF